MRYVQATWVMPTTRVTCPPDPAATPGAPDRETNGDADALTPANGPYTAPGQVTAAHAAATPRGSFRFSKDEMEPTIRLERTTCSLRVSCSTS